MKSSSAPTAASLRDAALAHLARYATTCAGLRRVLLRRVDRWAQETAEDPAALRAVVAALIERLTDEGLLDDAAYAERRGLRLLQTGRSPQAAVAHLRARGIDAGVAVDAVPDLSLDAALILARRRRIGPFRSAADEDPKAPDRHKEQAILARAGFARETADRVLRMAHEEAARRIIEFRRQS